MTRSLACLSWLLAGFLVALPALARSGSPDPNKVRPVLECVIDNEDGTYTASFGYLNENAEETKISVGGKNRFHPSPRGRGQHTAFLPGRHYHAFQVDFNGSNLVWILGKKTSTASKNSHRCKEGDLSLRWTAPAAAPALGEAVSFSLTLENAGPDENARVEVDIPLPASLTGVTAVASLGTYEDASGRWTLGALGSGAAATLTVTATLAAPTALTAEVVQAAKLDPDSAPNNHDADEDDQASLTLAPTLGECLPTIDFETDAGGLPLQAGHVIDRAFAAYGMTVTTNDPVRHPAMLFDTVRPTGNDADLGAPNEAFGGPGEGDGGASGALGANAQALGHVLILSEDGDASDPDDNARGGTFIFTFGHAVRVDAVPILDVDDLEAAGTVSAYDGDGRLVKRQPILALGDNSYQEVPLGVRGVRRLEIFFPKSGAVPGLIFCGAEAPATGHLEGAVYLDRDASGTRGDEPGIPDVGLTLTDAGADGACATGDDRDLARQATGADGAYRFEGLPEGTYCLRADDGALPDGLQPSGSAPGPVSVAPASPATDVDLGYRSVQEAVADVSLEKDVDNAAPAEGEAVTFSLAVHNAGPDAADVEVVDVLPEGLRFEAFGDRPGQARYDEGTRVLRWTPPTLSAPGSPARSMPSHQTLTFTAYVDAEAPLENVAEIAASSAFDPDSAPGDCAATGAAAEDDCAAASVTRGATSGGGDAGVESDGNLATKLAQRLFMRREDAQARRALRAAPVPVPFTAAAKSAGPLASFVPETGPQGSAAAVVTPHDLLGVTNATSVFAADYVRPEGRRVAALFGATSPGGVLYDHAKATCDRLGGGRLEAVRLLSVAGPDGVERPFVLSRLVHADGAVDYAVSFVAYRTAGGVTIDSRFAQEAYRLPVSTSEVVNLQVWSVSPAYTAELVGQLLARLEAEGALTYLNTNEVPPEVPAVFVVDGRYAQGRLALRLQANGAAGEVVVRGTAARTEVDAERGHREAFEAYVALPERAGHEPVEVEVEVGSLFDASFTVGHTASGSFDQLYYADGPWSFATGEASRLGAFVTTPHLTGPEAGRFAVERGAHLTGTVGDWVSLFRYLRPGGQPADLSAYDHLAFTVRGQGRARLVVEKASIETWDQYGFDLVLSETPMTLRVPFERLARAGEAPGGFTAEDVTLLAFYVNGLGQGSELFEIEVTDVYFGGAQTVAVDEAAETAPAGLGAGYPNPFRTQTRLDYTLDRAAPVRLVVYDLLGRAVAVLVDEVRPAGTHTARLEAGALPSGVYLVRLETPGATYVRPVTLVR